MKNFFLGILLIFICVNAAKAQALSYAVRKELQKEQIQQLPQNIIASIDTLHEYLNGKLYSGLGNSYIHPYFIDNTWRKGKIWYFGKEYSIDNLKYDIFSDYLFQLYILNESSLPVCFTREFVREFMIGGYRFEFLDDFENSRKGILKPGYFEVIYEGVMKSYIRHEKVNRLEGYQPDYKMSTFLFVKKDGKYYRIKGRASFLKLLDDHKKEVRSYARKKGLFFAADKENFIANILYYYENL